MSPRMRHLLAVLVLAAAGGAALATPSQDRPDPFPHDKHAKLFPECTTCHAGMQEEGAPAWPTAASCASCHDGTVEDTVSWAPRQGPRVSNLSFDHLAHVRKAGQAEPVDSSLVTQCLDCHNAEGEPRMTVRGPESAQCVACHAPEVEHLAQADSACATCHVPLARAPLLSRDRVAGFEAPPSHQTADFVLAGHAKLAPAGSGGTGVAASCATCHARDFCITCHVNAPEVRPIQALALDARSLVHEAALPTPPTHDATDFLRTHGVAAGRDKAPCAACHTRESCTPCHARGQPRAVARLAMAGPGRGPGAQVERRMPATHTALFVDQHGPEANARPATCEGCHVRPDCLDCHRPSPGSGGNYHPEGFLVRHPSSAYGRDANCSDCHNAAQFCQSCHQQSGLTAFRRLGVSGFHDANRGFGLGHGPAARVALESCVSCHTERDCTTCHSAVAGGFRFNPHGPGFNPERMRKRNTSMCVACHGPLIPGGGP